ncbi:hypothetical protein AB1K70_19920 [Bremerella sp. JC770]|uniref:hypothetical protein n=1 Tax=Bremerella sp. JC770 TaxID=3232137 RepID=UPI003457D8F4
MRRPASWPRFVTSCCTAILLVGIVGALPGEELMLGWSSADLTPDRPVAMRGNVLSEGVLDPIFATALAIESGSGENAERVVLVGCDLLWIPDGNRKDANLRDRVRDLVHDAIPEIPHGNVILMATHTHVAPSLHGDKAYAEFAARQIAAAVVQAWRKREPGGIGFGLGHAALSHNRIVTHYDGTSRMYGGFQGGKTSAQQFSHIEGFEDHSVQLLFTVDQAGDLTGLLINTPCPAQVQRGNLISADYWHEARKELRQRLGDHLFILPQVSAAGDLATYVMVDTKGEKRMQELSFPGIEESRALRRQQIATRLADCVCDILPVIRDEIDSSPTIACTKQVVSLPLGFPTPKEGAGELVIEINALRLGDVAMVTNPFELYCDYGVRMKGRSPAIQTFVVELAGSGSYLPTSRAVEGGGYGAISKTCIVGPSAGDTLVTTSLQMLDDLWQKESTGE